MKKYSFEKTGNVYVVGDCHGEFKSLFHNIKSRLVVKDEDIDAPHPKEIERQARRRALEEAMRNQPMDPAGNGRPFTYEDFRRRGRMTYTFSNSSAKKSSYKPSQSPYEGAIFIVAGDCGLGFYKPKYYDDLFSKFNKVLAYNNVTILFVRGNHDDPAYFDGETINYSNIKAIPDYSVVSTAVGNILCVGGAISLDRTWRTQQEARINKFSPSFRRVLYWKDEAPVFDEEKLKEVVKECKIDYVVTHTAPSFAEPNSHTGLDDWAENDPKLIEDVRNERIVMDKIFECLRENGTRPLYWAYGHFDYGCIERRSDTIFRALHDGFNPMNILADYSSFTQMEEEKKRKSKAKKMIVNQPQEIEAPQEDNHAGGIRVEALVNDGRYVVRNDGNLYEAAGDLYADEAAHEEEGMTIEGDDNMQEAPNGNMEERIEDALDEEFTMPNAPGINGRNEFAPVWEGLHNADGVTIEAGRPAQTVATNATIAATADHAHGRTPDDDERYRRFRQMLDDATRRLNEAANIGGFATARPNGNDYYDHLFTFDSETTNGTAGG